MVNLNRGPGRSEFKFDGQRELLYKVMPDKVICHVIIDKCCNCVLIVCAAENRIRF